MSNRADRHPGSGGYSSGRSDWFAGNGWHRAGAEPPRDGHRLEPTEFGGIDGASPGDRSLGDHGGDPFPAGSHLPPRAPARDRGWDVHLASDDHRDLSEFAADDWPAVPSPVLGEGTRSDWPSVPSPVLGERTRSERTRSERTRSERTRSERPPRAARSRLFGVSRRSVMLAAVGLLVAGVAGQLLGTMRSEGQPDPSPVTPLGRLLSVHEAGAAQVPGAVPPPGAVRVSAKSPATPGTPCTTYETVRKTVDNVVVWAQGKCLRH